MQEIKNVRLLYLKGALLLLVGLIAAGILVFENPTIRFTLLLLIAVWGFCRAYYFAFYVIQHYADPGYRFAGLISFAQYVWRRNVRR